MEERRAIERLKRGDIGGLEVLVRRHQARAVQAAYLICRDRALAEDVAQSAFVRGARHAPQLDPRVPFGADPRRRRLRRLRAGPRVHRVRAARSGSARSHRSDESGGGRRRL